MKLIVAYIAPDRLNTLINELSEHHVREVTVAEARGFGPERDRRRPESTAPLGIDTRRRLRVEIPCPDREVDEVLKVIRETAPARPSDARRVLVLPVSDALDLATGQRGEPALGGEPDATPA